MWILLASSSAVIIGFYEVLKKHALQMNAVLPVLFFSTLTGSLLFISTALISHPHIHFSLSLADHLLIILKTVLVISVWISGFLGLKHLPISIAAPVGALAPVFTLCGAIFLLGEHLSMIQLTGCTIMIIAAFFFTKTARLEGISVFRNPWVTALVISSLLSACSSLYDKYLIPKTGALAVQFWFELYLPLIMTPAIFFLWFPARKKDTFTFKWSVPLIGLFLVAADYLYFNAVAQNGALIAVIDALRRSSILIAFLAGGFFFSELNIRQKGIALSGILAGVILLVIS